MGFTNKSRAPLSELTHVYTHLRSLRTDDRRACATQDKMQDAGWAPDVEKWESDTDTDHSDNEGDYGEEGLSAEQVQLLLR